MENTDIGKIGELFVIKNLESKGCTIVEYDTKGAGATDIHANKEGNDYLFQVKTAVEPNTPAVLSANELQRINTRAAKLNALSFLAQVQLKKDNSIKSIKYTKQN